MIPMPVTVAANGLTMLENPEASQGLTLVAERPADANHPYGHHKAEFFSAVLEGVLIIVAALLILREAWHGFQDAAPLIAPLDGLLVTSEMAHFDQDQPVTQH